MNAAFEVALTVLAGVAAVLCIRVSRRVHKPIALLYTTYMSRDLDAEEQKHFLEKGRNTFPTIWSDVKTALGMSPLAYADWRKKLWRECRMPLLYCVLCLAIVVPIGVRAIFTIAG